MKQKRQNCKYCGNQIDAKTTRKQFCSPKCRVYWNRESGAENPLEAPIPYIPPPKREVVEQVVKDFTKPTNEVKPAGQPKTNYVVNAPNKTEQRAKLSSILSPSTAKKPVLGNTDAEYQAYMDDMASCNDPKEVEVILKDINLDKKLHQHQKEILKRIGYSLINQLK